jgi:methionyl-tRNA formyltransferase
LCATRRGYLCLQKLIELLPKASLVVFSFREEPWEPPFLEDIRSLALSAGGMFFEATQVAQGHLAEFWESTPFDLMLVVSWRYMIPRRVYLRPRLGTFVFHDSLLPEYRGFSPTVWAVINGEKQTGVSLFAISESVDAGDIIDQRAVPIGPDSTIAELMQQVTQTYVELLETNIQPLLGGTAPRRSQDHARATFTCKRTPQDSEIDWSLSTDKIYNLIRASGVPYPGAYTYFNGKKLTVWSAARLDHAQHYVGRIPGRVVEIRPDHGSVVLTGDGALLLRQCQLEDADRACAADVLKRLSDTLGHK